MNHSYEEIRAAALDVLAGREKVPYEPTQYENLSIDVAHVFLRREDSAASPREGKLTPADRELFLEVFWDLFRQGILTIGYDYMNNNFPFCRLSLFGKRIVDNQDTYFFHDVSSYTKWLTGEVPDIDRVTLLYVQEALQAFRSGCILSSTVMLGVATEHTFLQALEIIEHSPTHGKDFAAVSKERTILPKMNKFKKVLDQKLSLLSPEVKEDLDTQYTGIQSIIRTFRNQAGHPTGQIVSREQVYVLLHLFIPYCRKMYLLKSALAK